MPVLAQGREGGVATQDRPPSVAARLQRLPPTRTMWMLVVLISLAGWFELYDLFFTGYIAPGLAHSGLLTDPNESFFGFSGMAAFVAATFAGLFAGPFCLSFLSDRYGRRSVFTWALLAYTAASVIMACQTSSGGLLLWRFLAGVGLGLEIVTIDAYLLEVVPSGMLGRSFALSQAIMFTSVPIVALVAWQLVPAAPLGVEGWRWVVLIGAAGAVVVWFVRLRVPESPLWLDRAGRRAEAEAAVARLEAGCTRDLGHALPAPAAVAAAPAEHAAYRELFRGTNGRRLLMLIVFNLFQVIGLYGFANWVPTLLLAKGIVVTRSLAYSALIAIAAPAGPLVGMLFADRIERKWVIVGAAVVIALVGTAFGQLADPVLLIACGVLITMANDTLAYAYHAYQVEVFPTAIRARAAGLAYSTSRIAGMFSGALIAFGLREGGTPGAFGIITACMVGVVIVIGVFGPSSRALRTENVDPMSATLAS